MLANHRSQMEGEFREVIACCIFPGHLLIWRILSCAYVLGKYMHNAYNIILPLLLDEKNVTFNGPKASHHKVMSASLPHCVENLLVESGCLFLPWPEEYCDLGAHIH